MSSVLRTVLPVTAPAMLETAEALGWSRATVGALPSCASRPVPLFPIGTVFNYPL